MIGAESAPGGENDLSAEDCRAQLARILNSKEFDATERERRFLGYVIDEALAGRGSRIKAFSVAVEVFGRDASFDPQSDPIVRVEAGHVRRAIERYYLTAGQTDPILITIPKGGYVPNFFPRASRARPVEQKLVRTPAPASSEPRGRGKAYLALAAVALVTASTAFASWGYWSRSAPGAPEVPRLMVEWLDDLNGTGGSAALARGLTQEIISQLSKSRDIVVVQSQDLAAPALARYVLAGSVVMSNDKFRVRIRMLNRMDGSVLWAQSYDGATTDPDLLNVQSDIAQDVAASLAQSYGAIFQVGSRLAVVSSSNAH